MASGNPPQLTLVANNDDNALLGRQAFADLAWNTRSMVPNLLAVMAKSGRPEDLIQQILHVADAIEAASRHVPLSDVEEQLRDILQTAMPEWNGSERRTSPKPVPPSEASSRH